MEDHLSFSAAMAVARTATLDMIRLDTLHYWIDIQDATAPEGGRALRIVVKEKYPGNILLCFQKYRPARPAHPACQIHGPRLG